MSDIRPFTLGDVRGVLRREAPVANTGMPLSDAEARAVGARVLRSFREDLATPASAPPRWEDLHGTSAMSAAAFPTSAAASPKDNAALKAAWQRARKAFQEEELRPALEQSVALTAASPSVTSPLRPVAFRAPASPGAAPSWRTASEISDEILEKAKLGDLTKQYLVEPWIKNSGLLRAPVAAGSTLLNAIYLPFQAVRQVYNAAQGAEDVTQAPSVTDMQAAASAPTSGTLEERLRDAPWWTTLAGPLAPMAREVADPLFAARLRQAPGTALAGALMAPIAEGATGLHRGFSTMFGEDPAKRVSIDPYTLAAWSLGHGKDFATDPLMYLGAPTGALYRAGAALAKEAPLTGMIALDVARGTPAAKTGTIDAAKGIRSLAKITEENIKSHVAPRLVQAIIAQRIMGTEMPSLAQAMRGASALDKPLTAVQAAELRLLEDAAYGQGAPAFQVLLTAERAAPSTLPLKYGDLPKMIVDNTVPMQARLKTLAAHQVGIERGVAAGAPRVAFAGKSIPTRLGSIPLMPKALATLQRPAGPEALGSPLEWLARGSGRVLSGAWKQGVIGKTIVKDLGASNPLGASAAGVPRPVQDLANEYADALALTMPNPPPAGVAGRNVFDLHDMDAAISYKQTGVPASGSRFLPSRGGQLLWSPANVRNWLAKELVRPGLTPAMRREEFDRISAAHHLLLEAMERDPNLRLSIPIDRMRVAVKSYDKVARNAPFWAKYGTAPNARRELPEEIHRRYLAYVAKADRRLLGHEATLAAARTNPNSHDAAVLTFNAMQDLGNDKKLREAIFRGQRLFQDLVDARTPYVYGLRHRQRLADIAGTSNLRRDRAAAAQDAMFKFLQSNPQFNGLKMLIDTLGTPMGAFWETVPALIPSSALPGVYASVRADIGREIARLVAAGSVDAHKAARATTWIASLSDAHLVGLGDIMTSAKTLGAKYTAIEQAAHAAGLAGKNYIEAANVAFDQAYARPIRQLAESWGRDQAVLEPSALAKRFTLLNDALDKYMGYVYKHHGKAAPLVDVLRNGEDIIPRGQSGSIGYAMDYWDNQFPLLLPAALQTDQQALQQAGNGFAMFYQYVGGLSSADTLAKQAARDRVNEAYGLLRRVYGNDPAIRALPTARQSGATTMAIKAARTMFRADIDRLFNAMLFDERRGGHVMHEIVGYMPQPVSGSYGDVQEFWRIVRADNVAKQAMSSKESGVGTLASKFLPAELSRLFANAAELEAKIIRVNAERVANSQLPLNVYVEAHLPTLIAHRRFLHLRAMGMRQMVSDLTRVLPEYAVPIHFYGGRVPEKIARQLKAAKFRNAGDLNPSMHGWWLHSAIYDYLEKFAPKVGLSELDAEAELAGVMRKIWYGWRAFNTRATPGHLKNEAALSLVTDQPIDAQVNYLMAAFKAALRYLSKAKPGDWMGAAARALADMPSYQEGMRYGAFPWGHLEVRGSAGESIKELTGWTPKEGVVKNTLGRSTRQMMKLPQAGATAPGQAPDILRLWDKMEFDLYDRAARMAAFDKYVAMGIPPRQAADFANFYLMDYSARWMNPDLRDLGYALMPFWAWKAGNLRMHWRNFVDNPARYVFLEHITDMMNDEFYWNSAEHLPDILAHSMATQFYQPVTGNQMFFSSDYPWEGPARAVERSTHAFRKAWDASDKSFAGDTAAVAKGLSGAGVAGVKLMAGSVWPAWREVLSTFGAPAERAYIPQEEGGNPLSSRETGWGPWMFGADQRSGLLQEAAWGAMPYLNTLATLARHGPAEAWRQAPLRAMEMIGRVQPVGWKSGHEVVKRGEVLR